MIKTGLGSTNQQAQNNHNQQQHLRQSPISSASSSSSNAAISPHHNLNSSQLLLEVKSKYDAEFRRFGLNRLSLSKFEEFYQLLERLHGLFGIQFNICYTDKDGDLLPINNDNNLARVLQVTVGILRLIILRKGECYNSYPYDAANLNSNLVNGSNKSFSSNINGIGTSSMGIYSNSSNSYRASNLINQIKNLKDLSTLTSLNHHHHHSNPKPFVISYPEDFRPVSAIIDVDIVPESYRRVRLHKHKSSKPLGFYIRDGRSLRVTPQGVEQVPGIFISRLMPGGLAESTGLLSVNDEVIEVNGIEVAGKTLDQVTDMMVANSSNLIITVKPTNQRYNLNRNPNTAQTPISNTKLNSNQLNSSSLLNKTNSPSLLNSQTTSDNNTKLNLNRNSSIKNNNKTDTKSNSNNNNNNNNQGKESLTNSAGVFNSESSVSSVNSSFSSTNAANSFNNNNSNANAQNQLKQSIKSVGASSSHAIADSGQINLDINDSSSSSSSKNKQLQQHQMISSSNNHHLHHHHHHHNHLDESDHIDDDDDDEEIHDATETGDNSDDKILTL